jgi:hypothetical protein
VSLIGTAAGNCPADGGPAARCPSHGTAFGIFVVVPIALVILGALLFRFGGRRGRNLVGWVLGLFR